MEFQLGGVVWFVLALAWCLPTVSAQDLARVRSQIETESPAWVGQRITFQVELLSSTFFSGTPVFDLPEVPGLIIMKVKGSPVVSSEKIDGDTWSVQRHSFSAFAHRAGKFKIPPFSVRFSVAPAFGKPPEEQRQTTQAISFEAKMPDGAEEISLLISTTDLQVKETWQPAIPKNGKIQLEVGDAVTREITMVAEDVPGMALPGIKLPTTEGIGVYPKTPVVTDREDRGSLKGQRTDSTTYVCEREGTVTLPGVSIPWWDLQTKQLNRIKLPPLTVEITATVIVAEKDTPVESLPVSTINFGWLIGLVVTGFIGAPIWFYRNAIQQKFKSWKQKHDESESSKFAVLRHACRSNDPVATLIALLNWLEAQSPDSHTATIEGFLTRHPDPSLTAELTELQRAAMLRNTEWTGKKLADELAVVRFKTKGRLTRFSFSKPLPPLNPR